MVEAVAASRLSRPYLVPSGNEVTPSAGSLAGPEAVLAIDMDPRGDEGPSSTGKSAWRASPS